MHHPVRTLAVGLLLALPLSVLAQSDRGGERRPKGPPPEAIEACEELAEDDVCSFARDEEIIEGTCQPGPRPELPLACRPDGHEPPPRRSR